MGARASIDAVDRALPQTQCTRCGYADCAAYAAAIVRERAPIDRCPPGGASTLSSLAALTGRRAARVDPECGEPGALAVAVIDEALCIGCTICIQVCPVDAIAGAPRRLHAVIDPLCSGCELCVAPCPADCIAMAPAGRVWSPVDAALARERHQARAARVLRGERIADRGPGRACAVSSAAGTYVVARWLATVTAAVERSRAPRANAPRTSP